MDEQITTITQGTGAADALPLGWLLTPMQAPAPAEDGRLPEFAALLAALARQAGGTPDEGVSGQQRTPAENMSEGVAELPAWLQQLDAPVTRLEVALKQGDEKGTAGLQLDDTSREALSEALSALQAWLQTQTRQPVLKPPASPAAQAVMPVSTDRIDAGGKNLPPLSEPEAGAEARWLMEEAADSTADQPAHLSQKGGESIQTPVSGQKLRDFQARLAAVVRALGKNGGDPVSAQPEKVVEAPEPEEAAHSAGERDELAGSARLVSGQGGSPLPADLQQVVTHLRQLGERLPAGADRLRHALAQLERALAQRAEREPMGENIPPAQAQSILSGVDDEAAVEAVFRSGPSPLMAHFVSAGGGMRSAPAMATNDAVRANGAVEPARVIETDTADSGTDTGSDGEAGAAAGSQHLMQSGAAGGDGLPPLRLPLRHPQWGEALAQRVMMLASGNRQLAQIRLHPAHLGPIEVSLKMNGEKGMQVSLHAHHALTREAIEQALPRLRELFDAQGIALADVQVQADGRGHAQAFAEARREAMRSSVATDTEGLAETDKVQMTAGSLSIVSSALVDHFV